MRLTPGLRAVPMRVAWFVFALAIAASVFALGVAAESRNDVGDAPGLPQAAAAPPTRVFNNGAALIQNTIKADKTADFEMILGKVKEALLKSEDPIRKQQAAGWKVYKASEPGPNGSVLYFFVIDPAVKDADYTIGKILSEGFPTEVQTLYKTFADSYQGGQAPFNLTPVLNFAQ
jgi:hypothetical protein